MRAVVIADTQIPFHDPYAIAAVQQYVQYDPPDLLIMLGDMLDFPSLTTKFTRRHADPEGVIQEIEIGRQMLRDFYNAAPQARMVYIEGNHEARLANYVSERAPELEGFLENELNMPQLLDPTGDLNLEYYGPYGEAFVLNSLVFKHGDIATTYTANKELVMEGSSGISGHTHRFQSAYRTDRGGAHVWHSIGCLCYTTGPNMPPGRFGGSNRMRDWQQGFAVVNFWDMRQGEDAQFVAHRFNIYPVVITDGYFMSPEGQVFGPGGIV